jgi:UDP-N-acetylglucosamine/UDP-N-acetylgalactosamine diphosphorylase
MPELESIRETLSRYDQEHLLAFWDKLDDDQRRRLLEQIDTIDWQRLDKLVRKYVLAEPEVAIPEKIEPPEVTPSDPSDAKGQEANAEARALGEKLLDEGKVCAFVVAGGQGTRLGYDGPKGCFPATPVKKKPLFQVFAEQILAATRKHGKPVCWYVMTSPANDEPTRQFFKENDYFGLEADNVFFLVQGTMPAIGFDGRILLADKDKLALSPDGHGGSLLALKKSGALDDMARRGVEYISYFQVDNPLVKVLDPLFVGLHAMREAQMSAKALPKRDPLEKLGNFCVVDGNVMVIEYSDLPEDLARKTTEDGRLLFSAGSIGIHVFSREFVESLTADGHLDLPFHRAEKKVPFINPHGQIVEPDEPNAVKLEMFVFDALPKADGVVILRTARSEEFSPVKNAEGEDSPATSLHDQVRRAAEWLEDAGVQVPRDADGQVAAPIEISPLLANDAAELTEKIDPETIEIRSGKSVYLGPEAASCS